MFNRKSSSAFTVLATKFFSAQWRGVTMKSIPFVVSTAALSLTLAATAANSFQPVRLPNKTNLLTSTITTCSSSASASRTSTTASDIDVWNGSNEKDFDSLTHPGYTMQSDPNTHTGGWLAHRYGLDKDQPDWIRDEISPMITKFDYTTMPIGRSPRILILYGSLREASFSRKLAYEFARLLELLSCDVRVYNPRGLPVRDPTLENDDIKVQELRALTLWSDGHVWVSPEMHGSTTGAFKNQIDWIPLNTGSVRPTQGKTCCVAQVNGGSQSFNAVNYMRILARWMRMPCCTNQSSVPKAWQEFQEETGRMKPSELRDRVVDVAEEFAKFTAIMTPVSDQLTDRYSERKEKEEKGRLLTQQEKETQKAADQSKNT